MITQQQQCYAAEDALDRGSVFGSIEEVQRFVDDLRDTPWWHGQHYDRHVLRVEVRAGKRTAKSSLGWFEKEAGAGGIELTPHGMCVRVVLHELAHVLSVAAHGSQSHDPWWARVYLTLVSCVMGPEAYLTLQRSFDEHGVDYDVNLTPAGVIAL